MMKLAAYGEVPSWARFLTLDEFRAIAAVPSRYLLSRSPIQGATITEAF